MGKITVKHYLNKKLKPEIEVVGKKKYIYYPLYVTIIAKGKHINKRSNIRFILSECEYDKQGEAYKKYVPLLNYEVDLLTNITSILVQDIDNKTIKHEIIDSYFFSSQKSNIDFIKLLNSYIDYYSNSIFSAVFYYYEQVVKEDIYDKLQGVFKTFTFSKIYNVFTIEVPHMSDRFVKENLSDKAIKANCIIETLRWFLAPYSLKTGYDIPYYDWMTNKIQPMYKKYLNEDNVKERCLKNCDVEITDDIIDYFITTIDDIVKNNYIQYTEFERKRTLSNLH